MPNMHGIQQTRQQKMLRDIKATLAKPSAYTIGQLEIWTLPNLTEQKLKEAGKS